MKGPMKDPTRKSTGLVFLCDRCKTTMNDRRSPSTRATDGV